MSIFDFRKYDETHPVRLDLVRFIDTMDVEDVVLANREDYKTIDSGEWVVPAGYGAGMEITYARANTNTAGGDMNSRNLANAQVGANLVRLSKMVWMEKGRYDAMEIGKISVISGHGVRAKTSVFIKGQTYVEGGELTIATDADGQTKLKPAASGDVVKAICLHAPQNAPDGLLFFELVD